MGRIIKPLSIFAIFSISTFYLLSSERVYADTPCQPIYGGGKTCASSTSITPDKKKIAPTPAAAVKRGFPVLSPVPVSTSPPTGPEALVLFSLIPAGILGWLLRRYSTKRNLKQPPSF